MQQYLSISEGAKCLGLTEQAFRRWLERGRIPYRKLGRRVLIPAADLEEFLAALPGKTVDEAVAAVARARRDDEVELFQNVGAIEHAPCVAS